METWPEILPQWPDHQFDTQPSAGLLHPDARIYPVRTRTYPEYAASYLIRSLTVEQFQAFRSWWDDTLNQCAPWSAPWLVEAGYPHHFCRFDVEKPWEATMRNIWFDLVIRVEIIATVPLVDGAVSYGG